MYAIFRNGKQITKSHPHKLSACIEAWEKGVAFIRHDGGWVPADCEIRTVPAQSVVKQILEQEETNENR